MFNLTTNLLCHKTSQQAATVQQLPSTELCLRIVWLSDGPATPSMEPCEGVDGIVGPSYGPSLRGRQDSNFLGTRVPILL